VTLRKWDNLPCSAPSDDSESIHLFPLKDSFAYADAIVEWVLFLLPLRKRQDEGLFLFVLVNIVN
jgi:hypothetical protein